MQMLCFVFWNPDNNGAWSIGMYKPPQLNFQAIGKFKELSVSVLSFFSENYYIFFFHIIWTIGLQLLCLL
jgi:hypothetical protein